MSSNLGNGINLTGCNLTGDILVCELSFEVLLLRLYYDAWANFVYGLLGLYLFPKGLFEFSGF